MYKPSPERFLVLLLTSTQLAVTAEGKVRQGVLLARSPIRQAL